MRHLIRQGEGPAAAYQRQRQEHTAARNRIERNIAQAQTAPDLNSNRITRATAAGDEAKLRGIPCLAKGVGSAIPGTSPHHHNASLKTR